MPCKNLHYLLFFAFLVTSLSLFPYPVLGATNQELEANLEVCYADRNLLKQRVDKECPDINWLERQCKAFDEKVKRTRRDPPLAYRIVHNQEAEKFQECEQLYKNLTGREQLLNISGRDPNKDSQCNILRKGHQKCCQDWERLCQKLAAEKEALDKLIAAQEDDYNRCEQKLMTCKSLNDHLTAITGACDDFARQLEAARGAKPPDDDPIPGTLTNFIVECNPMKVQPNGTVSCTAHGIYSSNTSNYRNLTNDSYTRWQSSLPGQSGSTVSARELKPGQTFTMTAFRGQVSDSATVTVVEKPEGDQRGEEGDMTMNFSNPMHKGMRLDVCMSYGSECGKSVADAFCRSKGYSYAKSFEQQVVGPSMNTKIMGDESICERKDYCTGFSYILCAGKKK